MAGLITGCDIAAAGSLAVAVEVEVPDISVSAVLPPAMSPLYEGQSVGDVSDYGAMVASANFLPSAGAISDVAVAFTGAAAGVNDPLAEGESAGFVVTVTDSEGGLHLFTAAPVSVEYKARVISNAGNQAEIDVNPLVPDTATITLVIGGGVYAGSYATTAGALRTGPVNLVPPVISGTTEAGDTLSVDRGLWATPTGSLTLTSQWQSNGSNIAGATGLTLVIDAGIQGTVVDVTVTGDDGQALPITVQSAALAIPGGPDLFQAETLLAFDFTQDTVTDVKSGVPLLETGAPVRSAAGITFDGSGDYATLAQPLEQMLPPRDACIEFWVRFNTVANCSLFGNDSATLSVRGPHLYFRGGPDRLILIWSTTSGKIADLVANITPVAGTFYHMAIVRAGNSLSLYIDGALAGSVTTPDEDNALDERASLAEFRLAARHHNGNSNDFGALTFRGLRITAAARYQAAFTPAAGIDVTQYIWDYGRPVMAGSTTWFNGPKVEKVGGNILVGVTQDDGLTGLVEHNPLTGENRLLQHTTYAPGDDHDNGGVKVLNSGGVIWAPIQHNINTPRIAQGANKDSLVLRNAAAELAAGSVTQNFSYAFLTQHAGEAGAPVYLWGRGGNPWAPVMAESTDDGASFGPYVNWIEYLADPSERPYGQFTDGLGRTDFFMSQGHPRDLAANRLLHGYFENGLFFTTAGVEVPSTNLPMDIDSFSEVWDGTDGGWTWDIRIAGGRIVVAFASFPSVTAHRYHRAEADPAVGTWSVETVVADAGGSIAGTPPNGRTTEEWYSGGIAVDPGNIDRMFASYPDTGGVHQIYQLDKVGANWVPTQLTSGPGKKFRPRLAPDGSVLLWSQDSLADTGLGLGYNYWTSTNTRSGDGFPGVTLMAATLS